MRYTKKNFFLLIMKGGKSIENTIINHKQSRSITKSLLKYTFSNLPKKIDTFAYMVPGLNPGQDKLLSWS